MGPPYARYWAGWIPVQPARKGLHSACCGNRQELVWAGWGSALHTLLPLARNQICVCMEYLQEAKIICKTDSLCPSFCLVSKEGFALAKLYLHWLKRSNFVLEPFCIVLVYCLVLSGSWDLQYYIFPARKLNHFSKSKNANSWCVYIYI